MSKQNKQYILSGSIVAIVLVLDQVIKYLVKTGMYLHEHIRVTDWFYLYFTENNGMAFGMEIMSKLLLTSFRIVAVTVITWFMLRTIKKGVKTGFLICMALIVAGAAGNIFDCVFYGQIFSESTHTSMAHLVPFGEGYQSLFMGKVVDMFYFPLVEFNWPTWLPLVGGNHFIFFSPIFNFADASISCGVILLLIAYRHTTSELFNER